MFKIFNASPQPGMAAESTALTTEAIMVVWYVIFLLGTIILWIRSAQKMTLLEWLNMKSTKLEERFYEELKSTTPPDEAVLDYMYVGVRETYRQYKEKGMERFVPPVHTREEAEDFWRKQESVRLANQYRKEHGLFR